MCDWLMCQYYPPVDEGPGAKSNLLGQPVEKHGFSAKTFGSLTEQGVEDTATLMTLWREGRFFDKKKEFQEIRLFVASHLEQLVRELGREAAFADQKSRALDELECSKRTYTGLKRLGVVKAGDLVGRWCRDPTLADAYGLGNKAHREIAELINKLAFEDELAPVVDLSLLEQTVTAYGFSPLTVKALHREGLDTGSKLMHAWGEGRFFAQDNYGKKPFREVRAFVAANFTAILEANGGKVDELLARPLRALGFCNRTSRGLANLKLVSLGDLVDRWTDDCELTEARSLGAKSHKEILGAVNRVLFETAQGEPLVEDGPLLARLFPLVQIAAKVLGRPAWQQVLQYRFGLGGVAAYTLEEIGDALDLTRERVRQVEAEALKVLGEILTINMTVDGRSLPEGLINQALRVAEALQDLGPVFEQNALMVEMVAVLDKDAASEQARPLLTLLLRILGFERIATSKQSFRDWTFWQRVDFDGGSEVFRVMALALEVLRERDSLADLELRIQVKRRDNTVGKAVLELALASCPLIKTEGKTHRLIERWMGDVKKEIVRLLNANGDPLHFKEITRFFNRKRVQAGEDPVSTAAVTRYLVGDPEFKSIGRSGLWGLADWDHIRTESAHHLIVEFFHGHGKSATVKEVFDYVSSKRPDLSERTVHTTISMHKDFVRVGPARFGLACWGLKEVGGPGMGDGTIKYRILEAALEQLHGQAGLEMALADLVTAVRDRHGDPESTVRIVLDQAPFLETVDHPELAGRKQIRLLDEHVNLVSTVKRRPLLRDRVTEAVLGYFAENGVDEVKLSVLVRFTEAETGCPPQTFYSYVNHIAGLRKEVRNGKTWCMVARDEPVLKVDEHWNFTELNDIQDPEVKGQALVKMKLLNLDHIDEGLFAFGKLFESCLRTYLEKVREQYQLMEKDPSVFSEAYKKLLFQVVRKDLARLANMIDLVVSNDIIRKGHHLTVLREERNDRAHGALPSQEERRHLLKKAYYIVALYLEYIAIFCDKCRALEEQT